jgi:hypothetical protein
VQPAYGRTDLRVPRLRARFGTGIRRLLRVALKLARRHRYEPAPDRPDPLHRLRDRRALRGQPVWAVEHQRDAKRFTRRHAAGTIGGRRVARLAEELLENCVTDAGYVRHGPGSDGKQSFYRFTRGDQRCRCEFHLG